MEEIEKVWHIQQECQDLQLMKKAWNAYEDNIVCYWMPC